MTKTLNMISVMVASLLLWAINAEAQVTKENLDQNADQAQGNYATTNLNYLGSGSLGMMQSAWKDPLQHMGEGQTRPGYTKYYWTPELVLPVRLREGMYTLINFPNWEVVESVYLGDSQSFNAEIQGPSSLMVYPEASQFVGVDTNMIVFGRSGNKYVFYVQSETVNTDRITNAIIDIEVVKKSGANSPTASGVNSGGYVSGGAQDGLSADANYTRNLQKEDWIEKIPVDPTKFRFDIEVYVPNPDDIIIAPERVWRDNIFTYIDLGEKALTSIQRPIVTLIVERSETPVGFRAAGPNNRLIIVEGMGDMVLRSGKRMVCLKLRRADTDGLENAIYAKTNEWDLQNAYASQPQGGAMANDSSVFEDVYNNNESNTAADKDSSFFSNLFTQGAPKAADERQNTAQPVMPNNNGVNGININNIDSLPKVTPVVAQSTANAETPVLTGQIDAKIGSSEVVTPDYNNQPIKIDVTSEPKPDILFKNESKPVAPRAKKVGLSDNNSNPVLIDSSKKEKTLMSPETEALLQEYRSGKFFNTANESNISIELGEDENVNNLERLWKDISKSYSATLGQYQPFYSVDAPADGQGKDVFHLRVGPVKSLKEGDNVCSQLGRNGIFCSVVRIQ